MNIVIDIKGQAEADFWLALAKEKGATAICVEDAEDTWLSGLISKGMQEQTLTQDEMHNVLSELEATANDGN